MQPATLVFRPAVPGLKAGARVEQGTTGRWYRRLHTHSSLSQRFDAGGADLYNSLEAFCKEVELPLYEYACLECGQHIEKIQKFSDPPLTVCEKCGGRLKRLLSSPAIQFKGTGWYVTDYARKSSSPAGSSSVDSGNGDKAKASGDAKKEQPAAKKSEDKPVADKKA